MYRSVLVIEFPNRLYLTFDVEDFINHRSLKALYSILMLLSERDQKGLFFITGHMVERLVHFPRIVRLLGEHEIGYHSTSHSVHPNIFEYTDVENYQEAYQISLRREVAHINPFSGQIEGKGGIELLKDTFPHKRIESFRAPGFSWSPPHLEALTHLGIKFDFSTNISDVPVTYRGTTFFPLPSFIDSVPLQRLVISVAKRKTTVLDFHPNYFANQDWWDSIYLSGTNPRTTLGVAPRTSDRFKTMLRNFAFLLRFVDILDKSGLTKSCSEPVESEKELDQKSVDVSKVYNMLISWPSRQFNYRPKFVRSHLSHFFGQSGNN